MSYQNIEETASLQYKETLAPETHRFSVKRIVLFITFVVGVLVGGFAVSNKDALMSSPSLRSSTELVAVDEPVVAGVDVDATTYTYYLSTSSSVSSTDYQYTFSAVASTCTATNYAKFLYTGGTYVKPVGAFVYVFSASGCATSSLVGLVKLSLSSVVLDSYTSMYVKISSA